MATIQSWDLNLAEPLRPDTPLIQSGLLDSLALFNLLMWVEDQIGEPIDPAALDLGKEWNSVNHIVAFVQRRVHRAG